MHADDNAERTTDRGYLISRLPSQITNHNELNRQPLAILPQTTDGHTNQTRGL